MTRVYTTQQLGPKQSFTPEGYLLCEEVPIARTGRMIYGPGETSIDVGPDGITVIERDPEEVFRDETIASFEGKPVTNEHPPETISPENFKEFEVGVVLNVRRGKGVQDDLMLADLLIKSQPMIDLIRSKKKKEVSCGYDADYVETGPGKGRQENIIGNHVAVVESGRCGPRCAVGDQSDRSNTMTKRNTVWDAFIARITRAARDGGEVEVGKLLGAEGMELGAHAARAEGEDDEGHHVHIHLGELAGALPAGQNTDPKAITRETDPDNTAMSRDDESEKHQAGDIDALNGRLSLLESCIEHLTDLLERALDEGDTQDEDRGDLSEEHKEESLFEVGSKGLPDRKDPQPVPEPAMDKRFKDMRDRLKDRKARRRGKDGMGTEGQMDPQDLSGGLPASGMTGLDEEGEASKDPDTKNLEFEAPEGTEDKARKARDSSYLIDAFRDTLSLAEILAPGCIKKAPTFDRAAKPLITFDTITKMRRHALTAAVKDADTASLIARVAGVNTKDFSRFSNDSIRTIFKAAGVMKKAETQARLNGGTRDRIATEAKKSSGPKSLADLNKQMAEHYAKETNV